MPDLSHVCNFHWSSLQHQILNPPSGARDQTLVLMDTSWVRYGWATTETPEVPFFFFFFLPPRIPVVHGWYVGKFLTLWPETWVNSHVSLKRFFGGHWGFLHRQSCHLQIKTLWFFPLCTPFVSLSCLAALARTCGRCWREAARGGLLTFSFLPDLRGEVLSLSLLNTCQLQGFVHVLYQVKEILLCF